MTDKQNPSVTREEFVALCEQVARIAAALEAEDRFRDPDGPNGWQLRTSTEIKNGVLDILNQQKSKAAE